MGEPRSKTDICRNCGVKIYWRRAILSPKQQAENEAARVEHDRKKEAGETKSYSSFYPPHAISWKAGWYHDMGENGDVRRCKKDDDSWRTKAAEPKSFCAEHTENNGMCNRPVKEHPDWKKEPRCGMHMRHELEYEAKIKQDEENRQIKAWAVSETKKKCTKLATFGLEANVHSVYDYRTGETRYSGRVTVDPDALLELLDGMFEDV